MIQIIIFQSWLLMIVNDELQGTQCNFSMWDFEPWDSVIQVVFHCLVGWFNYWNVGKFCIEKFITYVLWMWKLVCHSNQRTYIKGWLSNSLRYEAEIRFIAHVIQLISDNFLEPAASTWRCRQQVCLKCWCMCTKLHRNYLLGDCNINNFLTSAI